MKSLFFKFNFLLLSCLIADYNFENITVRDGLSDDQCLSISSDKSGFIWIGTNEGLNRFDGYSPKYIVLTLLIVLHFPGIKFLIHTLIRMDIYGLVQIKV